MQKGLAQPTLIIIILILAVAGYFGYNRYFGKTYISSDTTLKELKIDKGKTMKVKNKAKITVLGNTRIDGLIESEGGVTIVARSGVEFGENAQVTSSGNVFLVDSEEHIPDSKEAIDKLFEETGMDTNDGKMRIGPLGSDEENIDKRPKSIERLLQNVPAKPPQPKKQSGISFVKAAMAKDEDTVVLRGKWKINPPKKEIENPVFFVNFPGKSIEINGSLDLPNGRDAQTVKGGCSIFVPDEEEKDRLRNNNKNNRKKDAARARFRAEKVTIGDFKLTLGDGGKGADAETDACDYALASAGTGGQSGDLKITAGTEIVIKNKFTLIPGKGGRGGDARAYGKKGESGNPGEEGGIAGAEGGYGANNIKDMKAIGDIKGLDKLFIGPMIGGDGGDGIANPGDGGDGDVCDSKGGLSGFGRAEVGFGGMPFAQLLPGVKRVEGVKDELGKDGKAIVNEAKAGKDGPACEGDGKKETPDVDKSSQGKASGLLSMFKFNSTALEKATDVKLVSISYKNYPIKKFGPFLPIKVELTVDGNLVWQTQISAKDCNDEIASPSCNVNGYKYDPSWKNRVIEFKAFDARGVERARYTQMVKKGS